MADGGIALLDERYRAGQSSYVAGPKLGGQVAVGRHPLRLAVPVPGVVAADAHDQALLRPTTAFERRGHGDDLGAEELLQPGGRLRVSTTGIVVYDTRRRGLPARTIGHAEPQRTQDPAQPRFQVRRDRG